MMRRRGGMGGLLARAAAAMPPAPPNPPGSDVDFAAAAAYAGEHGGLSLFAWRDGERVYEHCAEGRDVYTPHALASVSKSLCGLLAAAAIADGLLSLDERVADTFPAWRDDARKAAIRVRDLLGMTSGLRFVPPPGIGFDAALQLEAEDTPTTRFHYNGANYQVFGALLRHKLGGAPGEPLAYLQRRVFDTIQVRIADWRTAGDDPFLPGGGMADADNLGRVGMLLLNRGVWNGREVLPAAVLDSLVQPGAYEPRYALTFWLLGNSSPGAYMAAGLGGQRIYVLPQQQLVVVRQARLFGAFGAGASFDDLIGGHGYEDAQFLSLLLRR